VKKFLMAATLVVVLAGAAPAYAAGCITGAIVGGIAAKATHHSMLLGALGGCIVAKVVSHPSSSITYADVTGKMLGADADFAKIAGSSRVSVIKTSTLKGYVKNDTTVQAAISGSASVKALDAEIAGDASLTAALKSAGFAPTDVIAISSGGILSGASVFVNS
jgi:hypothetical protein